MEPRLNTLQAMLHCSYKAWRLTKENFGCEQKLQTISGSKTQIVLPTKKITTHDKLAIAALCYAQTDATNQSIEIAEIFYGTQLSTICISRYAKQAKKLLDETQNIISKNEPPT